MALIFARAHTAIEKDLHAPLMLQAVLGLDGATIASAFLISPAAMSQRLVRAKARIHESGIPFRVPERSDLKERLPNVLGSDLVPRLSPRSGRDPAGTDAAQRELASEAIWLGRLVVMLLPHEPEALGLLSLMLHCEARCGARRNGGGEFIPLSEQETARHWDGAMIAEAETLLFRASELQDLGRFQLEAALQSAYAARRDLRLGRPDRRREAMPDALLEMTESSVVAVNRAVAIGEKDSQEGLAALNAVNSASMSQYQPYWAARAHLLARAGETELASAAYDHAIGLAIDPAIRSFLQKRKSGSQQTGRSLT